MKATLEIEFSKSSTAAKALKSLEQETSFKKRSNSHMRVKGKVLLISIEAAEFPALRATVHSYLRLLNVLFAVLDLTEKEG
jgi:tRNA threonylcarbamoyladenosine modification (KEOPS) complex  Pcc1 subunit